MGTNLTQCNNLFFSPTCLPGLSHEDYVLVTNPDVEITEPRHFPLEVFYAQGATPVDFSEGAKGFLLRWMKETGFLESAQHSSFSLLCPLRFPFILQLRTWVQQVEYLRFALNKLQPTKVILKDSNESLKHNLKTLCEAQNIAWEMQMPTASTTKRLQKAREKGVLFRFLISWFNKSWTQTGLTKSVNFVARYYGLGKWLLYRAFHPTLPSTLVFSSTSNWQPVQAKAKKIYQEVILQRAVDTLKKNQNPFVTFSLVDTPEIALRTIFTQPFNAFPWNGIVFYLEIFHAKKLQEKKELLKNQTKTTPLSDKATAYQGVTLPLEIKNRFEKAAKNWVTLAVERMAAVETLFDLLTPQLIVMKDEYSGWYATLIASIKYRIKSIAVSHAVIFPYRSEYLFERSEKTELVPTPSHLCVWGEHEKKMVLSGGAFQEEKVHVIGSPKILADFGHEKYQSLWTSSPRILCTSNNRHHFFARKLLQEWKGIDDSCSLLIKLHPRELDFQQYRYWSSVYGLKNVSSIKNVDVLPLLQNCDWHMSFSSTTIIEAAQLGKPTLIFDDGLKQDPLEAVKMGIAYFVSDFKDLKEAFAFLQSPEQKQKFESARQEFLKVRFQPAVSLETLVENSCLQPIPSKIQKRGETPTKLSWKKKFTQ